MASRLRPRSTSELIDVLFALLREHYLAFLTITAVGLLPVVALIALYFGIATEGVPNWWLIGLIALAAVVGLVVTQGALILAGSDAYLHDRVDVEETLRRAVRQAPTTFFAYVISFAVIMVGYLFLLIPGIYAAGAMFALPAIALLEDVSPTAAVGRSFSLTKGRKLAILGSLFLVGLISGIVRMVAGMFGGIVGPMTGVWAQAAAFLALHPLTTLMAVLLYYDVRIRAEGFDLDFETQSLGMSGD